MTRTQALLVLLPLTLPLLAANRSAAAPAQGTVASLVAEEVKAAGKRDAPALWQRALELRQAESQGEAGELDRALDEWLGKKAELTPQAAVLLSACRLQGETPDVSRLADALTPLLDGNDVAIASAAAELISNPAFKKMAPARRDELTKRMLERAEDGAQPPTLRLSFAKVAFRMGGGKERIKANKILRSFLDSEDAELRAEGALTMAELDSVVIEGDLRKVLERLKMVPDERGQLAASYLEREDLRRKIERDRMPSADVAEKLEDKLPEMKEFLAVLRLIRERHLEGKDVKQEKLFEAAINGMLNYMDQFSSLLPSEQFSKFYGELEAEYGGIGAYVNDDPDDGLFTIVRPIYTGPAYKKGLVTDDKIVRIGDWPTINQPVDEIIQHLKGKPGTAIDLYVWRRGMDLDLIERPTDEMKVSVTRESVRIPPGCFQMLPGGVGLLQLDTFSQVAMEESKKWIPEMLKLGMKALILDLRFNGGGLLPEAQEVAELFLPRGKIVVSTEGPDEDNPGHDAKATYLTRSSNPVLPASVPLVVLTGRSTASAAEIVSGALQDNQRATLVGQTTYGKGSVQQLIPILVDEMQDRWEDENGNGMWDQGEAILLDKNKNGKVDYAPRVKLTIARYRLPSGRSIHREVDRDGKIIKEGGVTPDVKVEGDSIEGWRITERLRIRPEVRKHVEENYAANRELYNRLAVNDMKNPELYPGFEGFFAGLDTTLAADDVRRELRREVRRRVQDDRGAEFPIGDFVEDPQLQKAISVALEKLGEDPTDVSDYNQVFDLPAASKRSELALGGRGASPDVSRALGLLKDAREGGRTLTDDQMEQLIEILGAIDPLKKN